MIGVRRETWSGLDQTEERSHLLEVIRSMWGKGVSFALTEHISEFMILFQNTIKVHGVFGFIGT